LEEVDTEHELRLEEALKDAKVVHYREDSRRREGTVRCTVDGGSWVVGDVQYRCVDGAADESVLEGLRRCAMRVAGAVDLLATVGRWVHSMIRL
jgi:hypothetical protein